MSVLPSVPSSVSSSPGRAARGGRAMNHGAGFWVVAAAFLTAMAFSTVPTPLWALYQRQDGFSTFTVTVVFAAYALGVAVSLFLAGHVSDWLGRRRVLLPAVVLEAVAAAMFLSSASLPVLIAARVVSGLGIGMITATATAHLAELHALARPAAGRTRSDLVATAANLGGLAVGPLVSGLLASHVRDPLRVPYLIFLALLVVGAAAVALVPETVEPAGERPRYRPQRVTVPAASRGTYFASSAAAFAAFAVLGLFTSLAPAFLAGAMHRTSHALAGLTVFLVFGAAAATQVVVARLAVRWQLAGGLVLMSVGVVGVTAAVRQPDFALFLLAGVVSGAGAGTLFKGSVATVVSLAPERSRGEALAGLFLAAYVGLAVPVLGVGAATRFVSDEAALLGFTVALVAVNVAVGTRLLRRR